MSEHQMLAILLIIILAVVIIVAREMRLIAQAVAHVAETSSRSKRISAKVLTMLAGIENENQ